MATGRFVWHDLRTTDVEAAKAFYADLFGWTYELWKPGERDYSMIVSGGTQWGGIGELEGTPGVPPHWLSHVSVADVDRALERVEALGGAVLFGPEDTPDVGRVSVASDPQGAVLGLFTPAGEEPPLGDPRMPGAFAWHELLTFDVEGAKAFYGDVIGWTAADMDMGEMGTYTLWRAGDADAAGLLTMPAGVEAPPNWLVYIGVADAAATVAAAESHGAEVHVPATQTPTVGSFAVLADPQGATFAIIEPESP
jgi:predicted enzyme related to lactoylglutathione lyase